MLIAFQLDSNNFLLYPSLIIIVIILLIPDTDDGDGTFDTNAEYTVVTFDNRVIKPMTNYTLHIQAFTDSHRYSLDTTTFPIMTPQEGKS